MLKVVNIEKVIANDFKSFSNNTQ